MHRSLFLLATCALGLFACNALAPRATPTPRPVLADSFFSGYAFVDTNGNGQVDEADAPLKDAIFTVKLGYGEVGALTDSTGMAFIIVPGGVEYPAVMSMEPPKDSDYVLIGPASITRNSGSGPKAEFLFTTK